MNTMPKSTKEEKYRWIKPILNKQIATNEYNNSEHCALNGLSPNEFFRLSKVQNVCGQNIIFSDYNNQ